MNGDIQAWLNAAGRYPLLSKAEEVHLGTLVQRSQQPDATPGEIRAGARAKDRFIRCNLRLVISISKKYLPRIKSNPALAHSDLLQEGVIGLNRAVEKFDPERGYKFSTYGTLWIRQAMGALLLQLAVQFISRWECERCSLNYTLPLQKPSAAGAHFRPTSASATPQ